MCIRDRANAVNDCCCVCCFSCAIIIDAEVIYTALRFIWIRFYMRDSSGLLTSFKIDIIYIDLDKHVLMVFLRLDDFLQYHLTVLQLVFFAHSHVFDIRHTLKALNNRDIKFASRILKAQTVPY